MFDLSNHGKKSVPYSDVFKRLGESYKPSTQRSKGRYPKLRRGTFSKLLRYLIEHGLIEEEYTPTNHRNKILKLTINGTFTFNFINSQNQ